MVGKNSHSPLLSEAVKKTRKIKEPCGFSRIEASERNPEGNVEDLASLIQGKLRWIFSIKTQQIRLKYLLWMLRLHWTLVIWVQGAQGRELKISCGNGQADISQQGAADSEEQSAGLGKQIREIQYSYYRSARGVSILKLPSDTNMEIEKAHRSYWRKN